MKKLLLLTAVVGAAFALTGCKKADSTYTGDVECHGSKTVDSNTVMFIANLKVEADTVKSGTFGSEVIQSTNLTNLNRFVTNATSGTFMSRLEAYLTSNQALNNVTCHTMK